MSDLRCVVVSDEVVPIAPAVEAATDPTKVRVERWLHDKGVRLELAVAAEFRRHIGARGVDHARFYVAEEGGQPKIREIDVSAQCPAVSGQHGRVVTWFVVECKSSKSDPWVLYRAEGSLASQFVRKDDRGLLREVVRVVERGASVDDVDDWTIDEALYSTYTVGEYAYQIADAGEDPAKSNPKQSAHQAVQQVLSAVDGVAADIPEDPGAPVIAFFIPVIVTSAPLFTVDVDGDGYSVTRAGIVPLIGRFTPTDRLSLVWIVQEESLAKYVQTAVSGAHKLRLTK